MGCTGEKTYEEAVQYEMRSYINRLPNLVSSRKNEITNFINQDLKKKSKALENYRYIYREEDVQQTVQEYKILIWEKFKVGIKPNYEIAIEQNNEDTKKREKKEKKEKIKEEKDSNNESKDNKKDNNKENNNNI